MTRGVKGEGERVIWRGYNPDKRDNVRMGELTACRNFSAVSLEQPMSHGMCEEKMSHSEKRFGVADFLKSVRLLDDVMTVEG
jgi:hypothetical protein